MKAMNKMTRYFAAKPQAALALSLMLFAGTVVGVSGCGTFTKLDHPEVEVYDDATGKYFVDEVTPVSNCRSCHEDIESKYAYYSAVVPSADTAARNPQQLATLVERAHESARGAELKGLSNYSGTAYDYFYYRPWWYDPFMIQSGVYGIVPLPPVILTPSGNGGTAGASGGTGTAGGTGSTSGSGDARLRRDYRRGSGNTRSLRDLDNMAIPSAGTSTGSGNTSGTTGTTQPGSPAGGSSGQGGSGNSGGSTGGSGGTRTRDSSGGSSPSTPPPVRVRVRESGGSGSGNGGGNSSGSGSSTSGKGPQDKPDSSGNSNDSDSKSGSEKRGSGRGR